jgi:hypothetical protein
MCFARGLAAALPGLGHLRVQVVHQRAHGVGVGLKVGRAGIEPGLNDGHG